MKKLIEYTQEQFIVCDNPTCDYELNTIDIPSDLDKEELLRCFIDRPCPKCGENLLTVEDYLNAVKVEKTINWINKWFSWILYLVPKSWIKTEEEMKKSEVSVHAHRGITITIKDEKIQ